MTIEQYITKILSVAKIGLKYSTDDYAIENYAELEKLSLKMLNKNFSEPIEESLFVRNIYPTPNVSVRIMLINEDDEILFVKEADDKHWAVPGGWCDIFISPKDNAKKEVFEEVGIEVSEIKLVAIFMRDKYKPKPTTLSEYSFYFVGNISKDVKLNLGFEVLDAKFIKLKDCQKLSSKNTIIELEKAYNVFINNEDVYVD